MQPNDNSSRSKTTESSIMKTGLKSTFDGFHFTSTSLSNDKPSIQGIKCNKMQIFNTLTG